MNQLHKTLILLCAAFIYGKFVYQIGKFPYSKCKQASSHVSCEPLNFTKVTLTDEEDGYNVLTVKPQVDQWSNARVHVVIGNESCDLDSAVSAITYAYYLHTKNKDDKTVIVPVLNIPENQYRIRTETTRFFKKLEIQPRSLLFKDQVEFGRLYSEGRLMLTLVDHNVLTGTHTQFEECVVEVIDHHVRERLKDDRVKLKLDFVGSCCTLVAEELLSDTDFSLDEVTAELLYGTILVDTINKSPDAGKITPRDEVVLGQLEAIIPNVKGDNLFEELQAAKFDISDLLNMEILEKDLKMVTGTAMRIAMSSVTMEMKDLLDRPNFKTDLDEFCLKQDCEVVVIMTLVNDEDGKPTRQIAVYSQNRIFRDQIADTLDNSEDEDLELEMELAPFDDITVFQQGNTKASRKKVLPILKSFLHGDVTPDVSSKDFVTQHAVAAAVAEGFSHLEVVESENVTGENESHVKFTLESIDAPSIEEETSEAERDVGSYRNLDTVQLDSPSQSDASHTVHVQQAQTHDFDILITTGKTGTAEETKANTHNPYRELASSSGLLSSAHSSNLFDFGLSDSELVDPFSSVEESTKPDSSENSPKERKTSQESEKETNLHDETQKSDKTETSSSEENDNLFRDIRNPFIVQLPADSIENKTESSAQNANPFITDDADSSNQVVNFQLNEYDEETATTDIFDADDLANANFNSSNKFNTGNFLDVNSLGFDHPPTKKSASLIVECDAKSQADDLAELEESELFDKYPTPEAGHSGESSPFGLSGVNSPFINSYTGTPYHSRTASDSGAGLPDFVVPPNSLMDQGFTESDTDRRLPSFNNAEMVERIHQKKASLGAGIDLLDLEQNTGETSTPYTPQNSFREGGMFIHEMRDNSLPNLMDSEILEKVQQKRDSLSANLKSSDSDENADIMSATSNPFGDFLDFTDTAGEVTVPSTNPFFQMSKESSEFDPFAPTDSLADISSKSVPSDTVEKDFFGNLTGFEPKQEEHSNVDILDIFGEADYEGNINQSNNLTGSQDLFDLNTQFGSQCEATSAQSLNPFLSDIEDSARMEPSVDCDPVDQCSAETDTQSAVSVENFDHSTLEALHESANLEAADAVSETLAREIIHDAIESFPDITNPLVATEMNQRNDVDWTDQGSGDSGIGSTESPQQGPKVQAGARRLNSDYSVETEYLPSMDPLHGSLNITSNSSRTHSIETDADKEVVEGESFRKVSGEGHEPFVPEEVNTLNRTIPIKDIPEEITEMIIAENIESASIADETGAEYDVENNYADNERFNVGTEILRTLEESASKNVHEKSSGKDDITGENKDIENVVKLSDFGEEMFETKYKSDYFVDYSVEMSAVIEHVKDGILQENIQSSAVDMNLSNSNNNFVGLLGDQAESNPLISFKLDSEGNLISCSPNENATNQEMNIHEIQSDQPQLDINNLDNITDKGNNGFNETSVLDIYGRGTEEAREEVDPSFFQNFGNQQSELQDFTIDKKSDHKSAEVKFENETEKSAVHHLESYEDASNEFGTEADLSEVSFDSENIQTCDMSFQDNSDKGIDNRGFEFESCDANIEKDSESMIEEEINYNKSENIESEIPAVESESIEVPEKSSAERQRSESDNSISSDSSSSFPTTSESESELITVRENTREQTQSVIDDTDFMADEIAVADSIGESVNITLKETGVLNTGLELSIEEPMNVVKQDHENNESEALCIKGFGKVPKESVDIKDFDLENKDIESSHTQDLTDNMIMINQQMTESSLTVESVSPVETPLGEHASGFYEVNPETVPGSNFENLLTSSAFETNLGENETGFYEVNQDQDALVQSAVTIDSVSSVESPEHENVTGYYEVNAELLEQAIEKDDKHYLKIDDNYSDASVSPLETPEAEHFKGFYDINADNLEKAIERIDSLDLNNALMVEGTFSDDSSISPVETPELESMGGFYENNTTNRDLNSVNDTVSKKTKDTTEKTQLGPNDAPEINIQLVESAGSSIDSFDSETEPSFELNDSKSMEEERKVNEVTESTKEETCDFDVRAQSVTEISEIQAASTEDQASDCKVIDTKVNENEKVTDEQSSEFVTTPEITVEMLSGAETVGSNESDEEGFYEMNAEIQGTVLQNIEIGSAFSPIESPSEEVFNMEYEINPMVPDLRQNSIQSSEEDYVENKSKPFVRFSMDVNEKEVDDKVGEMADALVETALVEAIGSLQEQYYKDMFRAIENEDEEKMTSLEDNHNNDKYFKIADDLVNEAITSAIELVQEIRLNEEEPFITSEIASAMREASDSSDSEVSSTTTEGSYRIVNSIDLSPAATPDREEVVSPDLEGDKDDVTKDEIFKDKDLVSNDKDDIIAYKEEPVIVAVTNETGLQQDVIGVDSQYINDENGNITEERIESSMNVDRIVSDQAEQQGVDDFVLNDQNEIKEHKDKPKTLERQETLIPDIVISTEETPSSSDENEYEPDKEVTREQEFAKVNEVTEDVIENSKAVETVCVDESASECIGHDNGLKENVIEKQEIVDLETEVFKSYREDEVNHQDASDHFKIRKVGLIETENECGGSKAEVIDLTDDSKTDVLVEKQDIIQKEPDANQIKKENVTALENEANISNPAEKILPDTESFDELEEKHTQSKENDKIRPKLRTESENKNAETTSETSHEEVRNRNGVQKRDEAPYHNIKDLESEKDEKKSARSKKGQTEYVTRKEIFYTSAGRMSISIDSVVDPPSDSELGYTAGHDIIHEETHEAWQVSRILARIGSAIHHADEVLSDASDPQRLDRAHNLPAGFIRIGADDSNSSHSDDDTLSNNSQPVDDDDDVTSEKHVVVIEKVEPEKPKPSHEKMKMDDTQEWHEDPIPGMGAATQDSSTDESDTESDSEYTKPARPDSLLNGTRRKKKIAANNFLSPDSTDDLIEGVDDIPTPDDLETPSDIEGEGLEWEDDTPITPTSDTKKFAEYRDDEAEREKYENTKFRKVEIAGKDYRVDMKVIEPYKKVLSHGGYYGDGLNAIILFCGCYLPDRGRRDYQYVMDNLFLYVISTLELLVAEDYMIVYFHGATPRRQMPSFGWLKRCYQMIDRRLRKNLKALLMVHPTLWLKTVVMMTKPFISTKFSSKLRFVKTLQELGKIVPMEYIYVPEPVSHTERMLQTDPDYLEKWEKELEKKGQMEVKKSKFSVFKRKK